MIKFHQKQKVNFCLPARIATTKNQDPGLEIKEN